MGPDPNVRAELPLEQQLQQSLARQWTRVALLCSAALLVGVAIGWLLLRQQFLIHEGLVSQLEREVRGLTGDIQRMEQGHHQLIARLDDALQRMEGQHRRELAAQQAAARMQLESVERLLRAQIIADRSARESCLAEFAPYLSRRLAVPADFIVESLERLTAGRSQVLTLLADDIRAQRDPESLRLADRDDLLSIRARRATESTPLPPPAPAGSLPEAASPFACLPMPGAPDLVPIPDTTLPRPPAGVGAATHRALVSVLSFPSGRRVPTPVPEPFDLTPSRVAVEISPDGDRPSERSGAGEVRR